MNTAIIKAFGIAVFCGVMTNVLWSCAQSNQNTENRMKYRVLTPEEAYIIEQKGTERPFTGEYCDNHQAGTYHCKRCDAALYRSDDKFDSHCGWPSFDDEIPGAVLRVPDADGRRTEIQCAHCKAHLGHVFEGEGFTQKNTRHCVNSLSMRFEAATQTEQMDTALFAGGCFWGVEYWMGKQSGVVETTVGYCGGTEQHPTYELVCSHTTKHVEAVQVVFDTQKISFEQLARLFFNIHDPTQLNRQGPDVGYQYRSVAYYHSTSQQHTLEALITELRKKGYDAKTDILPMPVFWPAEEYHQQYYEHKGSSPYCHVFVKRL